MIAAEGEQKASRALREASEVIVSNGDVLVVGGDGVVGDGVGDDGVGGDSVGGDGVGGDGVGGDGVGGVVGLLLLRPAR